MSRKVDARALRFGITKPWLSTWFSDDSELYSKFLLEDDKIRNHLRRALRGAGLEDITIERSIKSVKIIIKVSRPGIVIGRKGSGLTEIRSKLSKITKADIELQIEEVKNPLACANIIAENIAIQLEKRMSARRAMNMALEKAMDAGARGVRVQIAGTVQGPNSIAVEEVGYKGAVPAQTLRANIDFAKATAYTRGGTIGVKVWVYKGEVTE